LPDLVITDMRMPGMNGLEVIRFLKEKWPALPVIVISAYARDELLEEAEKEGALEILSKPVDMDHLSRFVGRVARASDKVLVVEDDDELRINLCNVLQEVGHVVPVPARSMAQAERLLDNRSIKAAIIDLRLPDGDGLELGQRLRARLGDETPVVFITGFARDFRENLEQVLALGGVHLLEKPFPTRSFLALVESALARGR
jgi:CheY-like chemotaxis protein